LLLQADEIVAGYGPGEQILKGISFAIDRGEIVAVIGPNGAGKSTLFKVLAGLLKVGSGSVRFLGREVSGQPPQALARAGIAYVPQELNVFLSMTVQENLELGGFTDRRGRRSRIERLYAQFPFLAQRRRRPARTLSGGQRQTLAMAMALMVDPQVLLLDEPSAGLAPRAAQELFAHISAAHGQGVAIALVEQNALDALALAHRAYILVDGRNSRSGPAGELSADPQVRRLFLGG